MDRYAKEDEKEDAVIRENEAAAIKLVTIGSDSCYASQRVFKNDGRLTPSLLLPSLCMCALTTWPVLTFLQTPLP